MIDVNIPDKITITPDRNVDPNSLHLNQSVDYKSQTTDVARKEAEKLTNYIWENYIEPYEYPGGIWLIGAGNAFHCVAKLLAEHEGIFGRLNGVVGFICQNPLRPINSTDSRLASWYREKSRIFVSKEHPVWIRSDEKDGRKKISKRYGRLVKSEETILNSMMQAHYPEVHAFLQETGNWEGIPAESSEDGPISSPPASRPITAVSQPETPPQRN